MDQNSVLYHNIGVTFVLIVGRWLSRLRRRSRTLLRACHRAVGSRPQATDSGVSVRGPYVHARQLMCRSLVPWKYLRTTAYEIVYLFADIN